MFCKQGKRAGVLRLIWINAWTNTSWSQNGNRPGKWFQDLGGDVTITVADLEAHATRGLSQKM